MGFLDKLIQGATRGILGGEPEPQPVAAPPAAAPATPPSPWVPEGYSNPGLDQIYNPKTYVNPWDITQYKSKNDVTWKQDDINFAQAVTSNRLVTLENMLKEGGYVLKGNEWGKYEGGSGGDIVPIVGEDGVVTGGYTVGSGSKFIPLKSPAVDEWKTMKQMVNILNEDTANWSEADDAMIRRLVGGGGSGSGSGGSGGSGSGGSGPKVKTLEEIEEGKADEISRQRSEAEKYTDQYYDTVKNVNDILLQEGKRADMSHNMWQDSYDAATEAQVLRNQGKLAWNEGAVAPSWSDPLHYLKLEKPDRAPVDMWHDAIPEYVLPTYYLNAVKGLPGGEGFDDKDFAWLPRNAGGTGTPIWDQIRNGTLKPAQGGGYESTQGNPNSNTVTPASNLPPQAQPYADYNPSTQYGPGRIPLNSVLPPAQRVGDFDTHVQTVVDGMIGNILSGKGGYPPGYNGPRWDDYLDDQGRTMPDPNFVAGLTQWVRENANNPGITSIWGAPPSNQTLYIDDPSNGPKTSPTIKATQAPSSGGGGTSSGTIYTGVYGGQGSAVNDRSDPDLDKKLGWEREKFEWQKELDRLTMELAQSDNLRQDKLYELQVRAQAAREKIEEADMRLKEIASVLEQNKFEYTKEQNDKLQAFEREKFEYQKEKDDRADQLQRGAITADMLNNPNDPYRLQYFYAGAADPVGTAYDAFTGEAKGASTWQDARAENARLRKQAQVVPRIPIGGFTRALLSIAGDDVPNRATGHEEMIYNPTGAPLAVINNDDSKASGLVPPKGKPFGKHVKLGG